MLVAAILALGYLGVGARLVYLQVIKQHELERRAFQQQKEVVTLTPERGTIYDRNGHELAVSIKTESLYGVPSCVDDPAKVARRLAPLLGMDSRILKEKLTGDRKFVWLARKVAPDIPQRVDVKGEFKGMLGWLPDNRRYYPNKTLASHVLGFTGTDDRGLEGLEGRYQDYIGGVAGRVAIEKDASGREILPLDEGYRASKPGDDVVLTIDEKIQYIVEKELDDLMARSHPISATAIVMDPKTGEVLAMASRPAYNPNNWDEYGTAAWRNRAVADTYEPGSTFKIVTASAALEENTVRPETIINCGDGSIRVGGKVIHDSHNEGGNMSFAQVIQKSNNVGTVVVALKLGGGKLYKYAKAFGFGEKTGIDLPGEAEGRLRDVKDWSGLSVASVAIGQEVSVTPLQMLSAVNCVAEGGEYHAPYIVSEVRSADGKVVKGAGPGAARTVMSKATAKKLAAILSTVVEEGGTAMQANIKGYQVAGKTGTAQKYDPRLRRYSNEKFFSSFVGFVPADDPKLSAIVVVNEPKGQYYGGQVAAPAFKRIAEQTLTYMRVPTRLPERTVLVEGRP